MGTRADFYVGRGADAEWLGSIAWDGYPDGIDPDVLRADGDEPYRAALSRFFEARDDVTLPAMGWPWPWETSRTTDFAYALDGGKVYASCFGRPWQVAVEYDYDSEGGAPTEFPDMSARKSVTFGARSGLTIFSVPREGA